VCVMCRLPKAVSTGGMAAPLEWQDSPGPYRLHYI
jgi:hypothetical protein